MNYFNQESERLIFRKLSSADISTWTEFFVNNDHLEYLGLDSSKTPEANATEWINRQLQRYADDEFGHLAVIEKCSGDFVGMGGLLIREIKGAKEFEIGYSLKPVFWGKGYGTEIAIQIKKYGDENKVAKRFISIIHTKNSRSIRVAEKNEMVFMSKTEFQNMPVFIYST